MGEFVEYLMLIVVCLSLVPGSVTIIRGQGQTTDVHMQVLERGDGGQCPPMEERERASNEIHRITNSVIAAMVPLTTTTTDMSTTATLSTTTTDSTSTMPSTTTSATTMPSMYTCNGTPGWRRVAFINMTDTSYNCPTGLNLTSYSKRTCGRSHTTDRGCSSTTFSVGGLPYSCVCGRLRGYQFGATSGFRAYANRNQGIDGYYIEGVSLTHGDAGSRQHIWTFAAGLSEVDTRFPSERCPCDTHNYDPVPAFVGDDFFCESGLHSPWSGQFIFYPDDVLWDGQDCTSTSTCCQLNNPPWFTKNLTNATTDDIELRICINDLPRHTDVPLELIELYVQ